jgi:hypothetical protein
MQHDEVDACAARQCRDCRRPGVARCCGDDQRAGFATGERFIHQRREQLQREVFEGERWTVEQFEKPAVRTQFSERRDAGVVEFCVSFARVAVDRLVPIAIGEEREDRRREIGIAQLLPAQPGEVEARPGLRHVEAAVRRGTGQQDVFERDRGRSSAGADVFHRPNFKRPRT